MSSKSKAKSSSSRSPPSSKSSSASATKRLLREIQDYQEAPNDALLHLGPIGDEDLFRWEAVLKGVRGSAYDGGLWLLSIAVPPTYPNTPPTITFVTPICHPNISFSKGEICLTLLTPEHWSPMYTLSSTLSAVQQLLTDPSPESPLNIDIANLLREGDLVGAESLVRFWTGEKRWNGQGQGWWISEKWRGSGGKLGE